MPLSAYGSANELDTSALNMSIWADVLCPEESGTDLINESIDLNREIIRHPAATFYGRVEGDSMIDEGIETGDILVIDRSIEPVDGDLSVCCIDGEFTLKRIKLEHDRVWLIPSNETFDPILVTPDKRFEIWGVVTYTIKQNRRPRKKRHTNY